MSKLTSDQIQIFKDALRGQLVNKWINFSHPEVMGGEEIRIRQIVRGGIVHVTIETPMEIYYPGSGIPRRMGTQEYKLNMSTGILKVGKAW